MTYKRLLIISMFIIIVCLLNMPRQILMVQFGSEHNRTQTLEAKCKAQKKALALTADKHSKSYLDQLQELGWTAFQLSDVTLAESCFQKELAATSNLPVGKFDARQEKSLLNLATFYRERADFPHAEYYFLALRDYDLRFGPGSNSRTCRDLANLGLLYYLWAEATEDKIGRADRLCRAESFCDTAIDRYKQLPNSIRLQGNVLATRALILRELDMPVAAARAATRAKEILASAKNKAVEP